MEHEEDILSKWLQGELSAEQVRELSMEYDLDTLEQVLDRQKQYHIAANNPEDLWQDLKNRQQVEDLSVLNASGQYKWVMIILAAVLLLLTLFYVVSPDRGDTVTATDDTLEYALEDGSTIQLAPSSSIDVLYDNDARRIELRGQAFFEVSKGRKPFIVETKSGYITVLGTSFDVWPIDRDHMMVKCYSGTVEVSDYSNAKVTLTAGEEARIVRGRLGEKIQFDVEGSNWITGLKSYDRALVSWIISDIEKFHGVSIDIEKTLMGERFTGVISTVNQEKALSYLCETMNWQCEVLDNNKVVITQR